MHGIEVSMGKFMSCIQNGITSVQTGLHFIETEVPRNKWIIVPFYLVIDLVIGSFIWLLSWFPAVYHLEHRPGLGLGEVEGFHVVDGGDECGVQAFAL